MLFGMRFTFLVSIAILLSGASHASCLRSLGLLKVAESLGYHTPEIRRVHRVVSQPAAALAEFKKRHPLPPEGLLSSQENSADIYDFVLSILFNSLLNFDVEPQEDIPTGAPLVFLKVERVVDLDLFLSRREKKFLKKFYKPKSMREIQNIPVVLYGEGPDFQNCQYSSTYCFQGGVHHRNARLLKNEFTFRLINGEKISFALGMNAFQKLNDQIFEFVFGDSLVFVSFTEWAANSEDRKNIHMIRLIARMEEAIHALDNIEGKIDELPEADISQLKESLLVELRSKSTSEFEDEAFNQLFDDAARYMAAEYAYILKPEELSAKRLTVQYMKNLNYSQKEIEDLLQWYNRIYYSGFVSKLQRQFPQVKRYNQEKMKSILFDFFKIHFKKSHEPIF